MSVGACSGRDRSRWPQVTAIALFALMLMPVSYRAGALFPHGHALLQLLFEAPSDTPVHHHGLDRIHGDHGGDVAASPVGAPAIQIIATTALLPLVLVPLAFQAVRPSIWLTSDAKRTGRLPAPTHPPPRP